MALSVVLDLTKHLEPFSLDSPMDRFDLNGR